MKGNKKVNWNVIESSLHTLESFNKSLDKSISTKFIAQLCNSSPLEAMRQSFSFSLWR